MAYITKRGNSYGVRYTYQDEHGKNCDKWESFSTKDEATNRKKQIEHELAAGTFLIPSTITVREFLMEWLPKQCNKHKWAPQTYQSNLGTIQNLILPYIGDMEMQKLKPYHLEDLYATLSKTPCGQYLEGKKQILSEKQKQRLLSGSTIHEVHRLLRTAFRYAVEWDIILRSPVPVDSPKKSTQERSIWEVSEMQAALASMDEADMDGRYRNSGMLLRLPNGLAVEPVLIRKKFEKWQNAHPEFPHIVFHGLRHSSATYQLMISGGDVKAVQGTTGHASANLLVNTYAHIQQDSRKKLGKKFEEGFYKPEESSPQSVPPENEPTISVSALVELLKDADPAVKAQLRLALMT